MLRAKTLFSRTPDAVHRRSRRCTSKVTDADIYMDDAGVFRFVQGLALDPPAPGPWPQSRGPYRVICKLYFDENDANNPKTFVWCDCDWFKYNCETALAIRGSSAIINSNGALPKNTNPTSRPQVCKHCLCFLKKALSRKRFTKLDGKKAKKNFDLAKALSATDSKNTLSSRSLKLKFPKVFKQNKPRSETSGPKLRVRN